jgi:hypothetical protein
MCMIGDLRGGGDIATDHGRSTEIEATLGYSHFTRLAVRKIAVMR